MTAIVALDVDGVLAPDPDAVRGGTEALAGRGYESHQYEGPGPDGQHATVTVWLNHRHGVWLKALMQAGAELVWATSWGELANTWIGPRLDLPVLPVIEFPNQAPGFGWSPKVGPLRRYAGDRPLAWLEDTLGGREPGWAQDRSHHDGIPTLVVRVDPGLGLQLAHIDQVLTWFDRDVAGHQAQSAH